MEAQPVHGAARSEPTTATTTTTTEDITTFIQRLPKAELHVHLEGTLEPAMVRALATRNNVPLPPSLAALEQHSSAAGADAANDNETINGKGYAFHDLPSFLALYYPAMSVLRTSADFSDLTYAYLRKAAGQNVRHAEMFFDAQAHTGRGVAFPTLMAGLRDGVLRARRELGVSASLVMCFLRDASAEFAMATLMEALPYREWIVGVGLDSDERGNPPGKFARVFERARREGFMLTAHCDIDQVDSVQHIRQAVEVLGVDRVDHGTNVVEDEALVKLVREKGIGLTCCPISNSVVTADFKGKEIKDLLGRGVRVTVNSDDPAYFRGYINKNLLKMYVDGGMTKEQLVQLQRNAFEISWISATQRERYLEELERVALE